MAAPGPATPVGQSNDLQVMSPTGAAGDGQMAGETHGPDYGQGDIAGQEGGAPRALLNGVMSPSEAAQREARARTAEQSPGAMDGPLFGRTEPMGGLGLVSAPASPQALHPLMEQPAAEFQGQLHLLQVARVNRTRPGLQWLRTGPPIWQERDGPLLSD